MPVSRMDLADFGSPDRIAQALHNQVPDLPIPVPVEELARDLDILEITALETEGFEGGLLTDEERSGGIILVNEASPRQRRRFTIGHELGHFLSPWHEPAKPGEFLCSPEDMRRASSRASDRAAQMEVEANRFAALLLLPHSQFRRDLNRRSGAEIEHILDLARRYDMSKEATTRRYVELQSEPCAAIISHRDRVLRIYRGESFPYVAIEVGQSLPTASVSMTSAVREGNTSEWRETDAGLWLPSTWGRRLPVLHEQVHVQQSGYKLTLLALDEEAEEDRDEEEGLVESYTPRFRRR